MRKGHIALGRGNSAKVLGKEQAWVVSEGQKESECNGQRGRELGEVLEVSGLDHVLGKAKNLFIFLYTGHTYIENITDGISVALNVMGR